jgi:murein L,D-transpeptidase YcbB/YkuD
VKLIYLATTLVIEASLSITYSVQWHYMARSEANNVKSWNELKRMKEVFQILRALAPQHTPVIVLAQVQPSRTV